jgi:GxxExxY protein
MEKHEPLSEREEPLATAIVELHSHRALGPGPGKVSMKSASVKLTKRGLPFQRQVDLPIVYDDITFDEGLRLDVLVDGLVICELKSVESLHPVFQAQLLSHMKLTKKRLGFLINFNVPLIKNGIKRFVL